jgi:integrase
VRRSKEDQLAKGQYTRVPFGQLDATCPVRALRTWIGRVGRPSGPLFRVIQGGTIEYQRISERCVSRAIQRAVAHAGLPRALLRAPRGTRHQRVRAPPREIQVQGRWKDARSVDRYIRVEEVPGRRNVVEGLL